LLLGSGSIGLVAGLLFLIHPAQTEAVAWISSRGDLLLAFFLLGAWLSRIRYQRNLSRRWLSLALILYAQALLSKETAVMLPVAFIIADIMTPAPDDVRTWRQRLPEYSAWWGVTLVYFAMRSAALGGLAQRPYWGGSLWSTILVMLWAGAEYLRLLVLPLWLHVDYVISPVKTLSDWRWVAGVGLGLVITTLVVARYRRQRWPAFAWAWFLVFLLPVSNLVPITAIMAERFLYLPIIGACLLAAQGLSSLPQRTRVATLLMIAIPCVALSARRTFEWREPVRFWTVEVARSPLSVIAWNNLGQQYYRNGNLLTAENSYRRAIAIDPDFPGVRASLGDVYYKSGRYQEALGEYRAYLELNPDAHNRVQAEQRMQRIRDLLSRQPEAR
jgi:tetratricopeptide (TPR) repeat protein